MRKTASTSDTKVPGKPPAKLPPEFREIWLALQEAQRSAGSRQALARRLGISTATLQRILVRGDVPSFPATRSVRVRRAWARTLARLAVRLGQDPEAWITKVGIPPSDARAALARRSHATPTRADRIDSTRSAPLALPGRVTVFSTSGRSSAGSGPAQALSSFLESFLRRLLGSLDPSVEIDVVQASDAVARRSLEEPQTSGSVRFAALALRAEILRSAPHAVRIPGLRMTTGTLLLAPSGAHAAGMTFREALAAGGPDGPVFLVSRSGPARAFLLGAAGVAVERVLCSDADDPADLAETLRRESGQRPGSPIVLFADRLTIAAARDALQRRSPLPSSLEIVELAGSREQTPTFPLAIVMPPGNRALASALRRARDLDLFGAGAHETGRLYGALHAQAAGAADPWHRLVPFLRAGHRFREGFREAWKESLARRPDAVRGASSAAPHSWIAPRVVPSTSATTEAGHAPAAPEPSPIHRLAYCQSCAASLREEHNQGPSDRYCRWCSDPTGALRPREEVARILAKWMQHWQAGLSGEQALRRAESYMRLMPAWSEN